MIDVIQKTIDEIEDSLQKRTTIDPKQLAESAGYAYFSFQHLFKSYTGMPIVTYINKRRLELILGDIAEGAAITDAAFDYGFETYAGFYKAFTKQYGCSPKRYLALNQVGPTTRLNLSKESKKMLTKNQIKSILKHWNLTKEEMDLINTQASCQPIVNETYQVGHKYIFKAGKNIPWMKTHVKMTKALAAAGLESPYPIQTLEGEDYIIEDDLYFMLLHKVEGELMPLEQRMGDDNYNIGLLYGDALGKLHLVLKSIEDDMDVLEADIVHILDYWAIPQGKRLMEQWNMGLSEDFYEDLTTRGFDLLGKIPMQLVHRDPNPYNIIFNDNKVEGFIDFEISEKNVRLFDVCYCGTGNLMDMFEKPGGFDIWLRLFKGIVHGYNQILPLTEDEKEAIPYVIYAIQLIFIAYLEGMDDHKEMFRQNREQTQMLIERKDALVF